ncbi:G-actin binding protein, putative [Trypanosoma brucei gambiense DAL972]|uniref:G-actin binding protein, putative n=1 Tax=Trypanosoma brucei gambiense (strain MHOM/CI/86/DAL972) TaxID=679716 RepID=C9ZMM6_TRYB9|nr:G-actin binding protein, putative [Trypanosoma brucei gambiense DAL972]CBH10529.1 G-actin binding protein, putative [Trypanosoma brucei gambiense DAL972]|eukprot:XP_011772818.1 G-actin binding protein, putative [Trypanosoma brucei gambiense DAL972]
MAKALSVSFKIDSVLQEAFGKIAAEDSRLRALVITVEDETMRLRGAPLEATGNQSDDLVKLRDAITKDGLSAAFLIVKLAKGEFAQISFCSEDVKPKVRMMHSSGAMHLAEVSGLQKPPFKLTKRNVERMDDICESLFKKESESSRAELMTEEEKLHAAVAKLEVAPPVAVMPGVTVPISEEGVLLLKRMANSEVNAVTFAIDKEKFVVEKSLEAGAAVSALTAASLADDVVALLPEGQPRVVVMRCPTAEAGVIIVNVCPPTCKPRERMTYSSCRASFVQQAQQHNVKCVRRMEVGEMDEFREAVVEAFAEQTSGDGKP